MESNPTLQAEYLGELEGKVGFKISLKGNKYNIYRPKKATTDSEDITITGDNYRAFIQVKNAVSRSIASTFTRSFIGKLLEEKADDGLFISLASPVRGDIFTFFGINYSPQYSDEFWEDGLRTFIQKKLGSRSLDEINHSLRDFHKNVDTVLGISQGWRFRDFPSDFTTRLPWMLGFRVPTDSGECPHFSPSAIFYHKNQRYLFFITPKKVRSDLIRSWRVQQKMLNARNVILGAFSLHDFWLKTKLKKIKKCVTNFGWLIVRMDDNSHIDDDLPITVNDLRNLPFFDDNLPYTPINPLEERTYSYSDLPPCIRNAYENGVSDGRYYTTLLLSLIKDLTNLDIQDKSFFKHFSLKCYEAANRAMLAKKQDNKVFITRNTRYFPLRSKFGYLKHLPCDFDGGIWMGAQAIDKVYNQQLCQPDERCKKMGKEPDILSYLGYSE